LNTFFGTVFTNEDLSNIPSLDARCNGESLLSVDISVEDVWRQLCKLNPSKSGGPDGCNPRVFAEVKDGLLRPLYALFKKSLEEGQLPTPWKEADVTPIFKKGSRSLPTNYRPVSLTSIVCKMLESVIKDTIMAHFVNNNLFSTCQHGFRPEHSCVTQLLNVMEDWTEVMESGGSVDVIYLDFKKAFDRVPHTRLLSKLSCYGLSGKLMDWIHHFLTNRKQRVNIRGSYSEWINITSGVPQGSVLGPILFIIFINDLPDVVLSILSLFADDTKLYRPIRSFNDHLILQQDINNLLSWNEKWQFFFNYQKCYVMSIGHSPVIYQYTMATEDCVVPITRTYGEKDLGVFFSPDLKFRKHISNIIHKANTIAGVIKRSFEYLDTTMLRTLYISLIRPHLDYASVIWNPHQVGDIRLLEQVQRRVTRLVFQLKNAPYNERLRSLNLPSLLYRRRRMDMIMVYKIARGLSGCPFEKFFCINNYTSTRNNGFKLYKQFSHLNTRKYSFSQRVINDWNSLPSTIIQSPNVVLFKTGLDEHWHQYRFDFV